MNKTELQRYRRRLLDLRQRLRGEVTDLAGTSDEGSVGGAGDALDQAAGRSWQDLSVALLGTERQLLDETDAALTRIDRGTFGRCVECRGTIGAERLRTLPYTPHCVACARRLQAAGR
jgi:RNA polymerase-binding protein DksA